MLPVFTAVLQIVTITKYMRAPYGSGRFWSELKDTLRILLKVRRLQDHPLLDQFAADIARDHGRGGKLSLHSGEVLDNTKGAKFPLLACAFRAQAAQALSTFLTGCNARRL